MNRHIWGPWEQNSKKARAKGMGPCGRVCAGQVQRERRAGSTEREQAGSRAGLTTFTERNVVILLGIRAVLIIGT